MPIGNENFFNHDNRADVFAPVIVDDAAGPAGVNQDQRISHEVETVANGKFSAVYRRSA